MRRVFPEAALAAPAGLDVEELALFANPLPKAQVRA